MNSLYALIRDVPDFPKPGVVFKDIGPLLADPTGFAACITALAAPWRDTPVDAVCGIESRGFIFGAAMALAMKTGFVPLRKVGKLPPPTLGIDYDLEYGSARLEISSRELGAQGLPPGARVLLVDDVLATGGTLDAGRRLLEQAGAHVVGAGVVIEIDPLRGRGRWPEAIPLRTLLHC
jgi:adenine phosphoribosyltransferase